ncbi:MAG: UvrD-helicase domain-containing protein, partial [Clostridia bacterium]|nr:UvrD-helicase domain-containing protein [Clostridia bacterium]
MLTEQQRQAVENFDDNILLLARAGSGKTFTVANKIAEGIRRGISPERMLCLTFTVKAAEELRDEAEKFCGDKGVKVYTVHGFCHHILKEYAKASGEFRVPDVADEVDSGEIIKSLLFSATEKGDYSPPDGVSPLPDKQLYKIFSAIKHRRDELGFDKFSIGGYSAATDSLFKESKFKELFSTKKFSAKITDYDLIDLLKTKADEYAAKYDEILR